MDLPTYGSQSNLKKMTKINLKDTIIFLLVGIAYGMFAYFSLHAFFEYRQELTGLNQWLEPVRELPLPTITVCSQEVFKNVNNDTTKEMVLENLSDYVFAWEDLFDDIFTENALTFWNPHREIFSNKFGLCYSLSPKSAAKPGNFYLSYMFLPVEKRYQIFLHESGSEYWLQYGFNPSKKTVVYIDTKTSKGIYGMDGTLKYVVDDKVSRKNYKCDPDATMESFTKCAFNEIDEFECSSAINRIGKYLNETTICQNFTQLTDNHKSTSGQLASILYSNNNSLANCIRPCRTTSFEVSMKKDHENDKLLGSDRLQNLTGKFLLNFIYDDFVIENKKEYFVMNEDGLVSAVGGFLGLFLGSSLVSVIEWFSQIFKKCAK